MPQSKPAHSFIGVKKQHTAVPGDTMATGWALSLTSPDTRPGLSALRGKQVGLSQKCADRQEGVGEPQGGASSPVEPDMTEDEHTGW